VLERGTEQKVGRVEGQKLWNTSERASELVMPTLPLLRGQAGICGWESAPAITAMRTCVDKQSKQKRCESCGEKRTPATVNRDKSFSL
jgi:hypothetical protein